VNTKFTLALNDMFLHQLMKFDKSYIFNS